MGVRVRIDGVGFLFHAGELLMRTTPMCQHCKKHKAEFALQYIGDDVPQFYRLGYHIRGFYYEMICPDCKSNIRAEYMMSNHKITELKGKAI